MGEHGSRNFRKPDLLGAEAKIESQRKRNEAEMREIKGAVGRLFDTPDGRFVFKYLMDYCEVFQITMTGNVWTYFNEGKRDVGLHLLKLREMEWFDEVEARRNEHLKRINLETKKE